VVDKQVFLDSIRTILGQHPNRTKHITPREVCVIEAVLDGQTYQRAGSTSGYSEGSLQNAAAKLFADLSLLLGGIKVSRRNFRVVMTKWIESNTGDGRTALVTANMWVLSDRIQLVAIDNELNAERTFSVPRLLDEYSGRFERTICCQVWQQDPLKDLMYGLMGSAGAVQARALEEGDPDVLRQIVESFRQHSSLVIVEYDATHANNMQFTAAGRLEALRSVVEHAHNSCLVLVDAPPYMKDSLEQMSRLVLRREAGDVMLGDLSGGGKAAATKPRLLSVMGYERRLFEVLNLYR
jgi:hypothetical protein